jgi:hypothetical protein
MLPQGEEDLVPQGRKGLCFLFEQILKDLIKITRDQICPNQMFFISLESSQKIDI